MPNTTTKPATTRGQKFYDVPAGTRATMCKGSTCGMLFYWISSSTGARLPISCDVPGGQIPSEHVKDATQESLFETERVEHHDGRGVLHHSVCPDVDEFKRGRR